VLNLGGGRYEAALSAALEAQALWPPLSPEDAVEAAVRCGQPEVGHAALDDFAPLAEAGGTPWALGVRRVAGRCWRATTPEPIWKLGVTRRAGLPRALLAVGLEV